jgi:peptidoglycan/xylan/chitin deacetylase (PgdA/CDA1 family)
MKKWLKKTLISLYPKTPFALQAALLPSAPLIVFFHAVGKEQSYTKNIYHYQSEDGFRKIIEALLKYFKPLEDLTVSGISNAKSNQLIVTFDDGLQSAYEIAAPMLEQRGIPAIFFLNSAFMGDHQNFYRFEASLICEKLTEASPEEKKKALECLHDMGYAESDDFATIKAVRYPDRGIYEEIAQILEFDMDDFFAHAKPHITETHISDLINRGFFIGAHSCDHPRYWEISPEDQVNQTLESVRLIQQAFNLAYRYFAFPFGAWGLAPEFYSKTMQDVDLYFTTGGWRRPEKMKRIYHRVDMDRADNVIEALKSEWDPF